MAAERTAGGREFSRIERLVRLPAPEREKVLAGLTAAERLLLLESWEWEARPAQLAPAGDWAIWLVLAGRGFGKTRAGAEWVTARAREWPGCRIALVGATARAAESVMLEGESGLLAVAPEDFQPSWGATKRELRWPNGSVGMVFSAMEPDRLRGPQFHYAWCDEIAAWRKVEETWNNLRMGLRLGERPRAMATTTPRPGAFLRRLLRAADVVVTRGSTYDNRLNLPDSYLADMQENYGKSALGRQEIMGELLEAQEGSLWSRDGLEACRVTEVPEMRRVVIGVDPPAGPGGCGIVVAGLGVDGVAYVLADASLRAVTPDEWAKAVAACWARFSADRVVAEINNGGAMVASVLRAANLDLPLKTVRAAVGKAARAEPVATLYTAGRVKHAGMFAGMEDEMCGLMVGGGYVGPGSSPDRADACVWALWELMLEKGRRPRARELA